MKFIPLRKLALATFAAALMFASPSLAQDSPSLTEVVEAWLASPHADRSSEAFIHWNEEGAVPENCATCHSGPGFMDFVGADGTAAGTVDHPAPIGSPVDCATCHNEAASKLQSVTFPSGVVMSELGSASVCMVCHQGRESTDSVDAAVADIDDDAVSKDLGFLNVHYRAAAATLMGGAARGGYQYDGKDYAQRFNHPAPLNTCTGCHNPHTTQAATAQCAACHKDIETPKAIRASAVDADGDGDTTEGIAAEITALHDRLAAAIRAYAADVAGTPIAYEAHSYPYFFADTNGDGQAGADEAIFPNRYQSWTPRLMRAAYNYQFVAKDPGAWTHNPHYAIQLLFDSLESLSEKAAVDMGGLVRP
ncbi:MAG: polyheme membrane-associated cytochrome C [Paracoccaceae bacterium]